MMMGEPVTLYEMGLRDGLQNEARHIPTAAKVELSNLLSQTGLRYIEVTSFVSPKWVPQMADASEVMAQITRKEGVRYSVLTPNLRGLEAAQAADADEVAIFASASEGFSKANINASIAESLDRLRPVASKARVAGVPVRGYVSCVTDCPYNGATDPGQVAQLTSDLLAAGCYQVSLGDTIGQGTPERVATMLRAVLDIAEPGQLAGHYHDTAGYALENIAVSLEAGLRVFDSSVGGLGGCPYAPGASGNVATEAVAEMLTAAGFETGIDKAALAHAAEFAKKLRSGA